MILRPGKSVYQETRLHGSLVIHVMDDGREICTRDFSVGKNSLVELGNFFLFFF